MLKFLKGDMFEYIHRVDAIINTVNCVGVMGKGIALEFKKRYPDNFTIYKRVCEKKELTPGKMLIVKNSYSTAPKYIINFPTKNHWRGKSKIEYIENGLDALKEELNKYSIRSVAMPPLGCGNGGLEWDQVKKLIIEKLNDVDNVNFLVFEPNQIKSKQAGKTNIKMSKQRVLLLGLIDYINSSQYEEKVTYEEVNHLAFIANYFGAGFKLNFEEKRWGPFDKALNLLLIALKDKGFLEIQRLDSNKNLIFINQRKFRSKKSVLNETGISELYNKIVHFINGFETKDRLKALTITLWHYTSKNVELENLYKEVQNWFKNNEYKISDMLIRDAVNRVNKLNEPRVENLKLDI
jgi:O-acetyl-ADP-ribose deacetylase (regulator of RNase III)